MHLLPTTPGGFVEDTQGVIRIDQTPADIVVLSSADTSLSLLAEASPHLGTTTPAAPRQPDVGCASRRRSTSMSKTCCGTRAWSSSITSAAKPIGRTASNRSSRSRSANSKRSRCFRAICRKTQSACAQHRGRRSMPSVVALFAGRRSAERRGVFALHRVSRASVGDEPAPPRALPAASLYHPQRDTPTIADWQARWSTMRRWPRFCSTRRICRRPIRRCSMR